MNKGAIPVAMLALVAVSAIGVPAHGRGSRGDGEACVSLAETLALTEDQQAELKELRESFGEAHQSLRESHRGAFREVLTAEQVAALDEIRETGSRRHVRSSMGAALGLTEEQQEALAAAREEHQAEGAALRDEHHAAVAAVLTEEQLALLEQIRASHPRNGVARHGARHGRDRHGDGVDNGDGGDDDDAVSIEATALTTSTTTAIENQSWGQLKRGFE